MVALLFNVKSINTITVKDIFWFIKLEIFSSQYLQLQMIINNLLKSMLFLKNLIKTYCTVK